MNCNIGIFDDNNIENVSYPAAVIGHSFGCLSSFTNVSLNTIINLSAEIVNHQCSIINCFPLAYCAKL